MGQDQGHKNQKTLPENGRKLGRRSTGERKLLDASSQLYLIDAPSLEGKAYCAFGNKKRWTQCLVDENEDGIFDVIQSMSTNAKTSHVGGGEFVGKGWKLVDPVKYTQIDVLKEHMQKIGLHYFNKKSKVTFQLVADNFGEFTQLGKESVTFTSSESFPQEYALGDYKVEVVSINPETLDIKYKVLSTAPTQKKLFLGQDISISVNVVPLN